VASHANKRAILLCSVAQIGCSVAYIGCCVAQIVPYGIALASCKAGLSSNPGSAPQASGRFRPLTLQLLRYGEGPYVMSE
jgi:hypothetical protein